MGEVIYFPKTFQPKKKITNIFRNMLIAYFKKQNDIRKRKISVLYNALFDYFLTIKADDKSVNLPAAIIAAEKASAEILRVISQNSVDKYYTKLKNAQKRAIRG